MDANLHCKLLYFLSLPRYRLYGGGMKQQCYITASLYFTSSPLKDNLLLGSLKPGGHLRSVPHGLIKLSFEENKLDAAGVEPASCDNLTYNIYMFSLLFNKTLKTSTNKSFQSLSTYFLIYW